jgi:superfamily I DNA/RNA helicase
MPYVNPDAWIPKGVESLEPAANTVVHSTENSLVVAGPGAGKTELLAQRACYLLETGCCPAPKRILAISFKRDSAKNLADRVERRCGDLARRFDSFTLDAFGKGLVDRFRSALPKEWQPHSQYQVMTKVPTKREMRDWFESIPVPSGLTPPDFTAMGDDTIKEHFELCAFGIPLPFDSSTTNPLVRHFGLRWWHGQLSQPPTMPSLLFPMLNRLAALLLRLNPRLTAALRATYSHVFLDEFQDTTGAQYDVVHSGFVGSQSVLTAVGDSKQRIMLWAGAMRDAFEIYSDDFGATRYSLLRNYRSAPELVRIQQVIAQSIESGTPPVKSARNHASVGTCFVAEFRTPEQEAQYLSELIANEISQDGRKPRDFCILARQRTGQIVAILQQALREKGICVRDESELQDLLAEPVTQIVLAVLRLVTRKRDPEAWEFVNNELALLLGLDPTEDGHELSTEVRSILAAIRAALLDARLPQAALPALIVQHVGQPRLRAHYRQYSNAKFFTEQVTKCGEALTAVNAPDLRQAVDEFMGVNVLPAMTVHKSKGLEFHTVVFLGLEDSQLWNFTNQTEEEKRGFFVALSRAITRVIFTFSDVRDGKYGRQRQRRTEIRDLYTLLRVAGVETRNLRG